MPKKSPAVQILMGNYFHVAFVNTPAGLLTEIDKEHQG